MNTRNTLFVIRRDPQIVRYNEIIIAFSVVTQMFLDTNCKGDRVNE
jgi:hypothetical protein